MKIKFLAMITCLAASTMLHGQSVDDIIKKYFENTGGIDKWKALNGLKINAKFNQQGMEIPLEIVQLKDGRQCTSISFQGMEIKQGVYDGSTLWSTNFMNMKAERSDAEATENFKQEIGDFPDPFLNYKERGLKAEFVGKETIEGTECFKIKLTKKPIKVDGVLTDNVLYYYFDAENYVPVLMESEIKTGQAKGMTQQITWSDYQEVDGLMMPFTMAQGVKGMGSNALTITAYQLNPKVDEAIFKFPEGK
ncbi:MAG: outer membrane lipoprotein-sorting protein [Cyclobacteriaceae bacterium]